MKHYFLLLLLTLFVGTAFADNDILQIWQTDGQVQSINLSEQPVTTFSDGNLVVTTSTATISLPMENVKKYTYSLVPTGIDDVKAEQVAISQNGESITFFGLKSGSEISVYNASGVQMKQVKATHDTETVTISDLQVGVYAVKANGVTYKIMKR